MDENRAAMTGYGASTPQEVDQLHKALSVAYEYSTALPGTFSGAPALQVESLDKTLRLVTFEQKNLLLWNDIPKTQAFNTVEEYNTQRSYGNSVPGFFQMGNAPTANDALYDRSVALIKYVGTQKQINHNVMLVRQAHGPIVQRTIKDGAMWILQQMERALFQGDSNINALEFDGAYQQIKAGSILAKFKASAFAGFDGYSTEANSIMDLRNTSQSGSVIDEEVLEQCALIQANNFGLCTDIYMDTKASSDFSRAFYGKERINTLGVEGKAGYVVRQFVSGAGTFNIKSGVFLRPQREPLSVTVSASAAPTLANVLHPADALSEFIATDAGNYYYKISSVYSDGETLPSVAIVAAPVAGDKVTIEITYAGSPVYFNVYRSPLGAADGSAVEFIGRIAPLGSGVAHSVDYNSFMPGCSRAFMLQMNEDNVTFRQLLTMMKIDLAIVDTSFRWMQLLYGTPIIFTPRKNVLIKNIGRS